MHALTYSHLQPRWNSFSSLHRSLTSRQLLLTLVIVVAYSHAYSRLLLIDFYQLSVIKLHARPEFSSFSPFQFLRLHWNSFQPRVYCQRWIERQRRARTFSNTRAARGTVVTWSRRIEARSVPSRYWPTSCKWSWNVSWRSHQTTRTTTPLWRRRCSTNRAWTSVGTTINSSN